MSANKAHRGRYRTYIGLAVASAVGGLVVVGAAAAAPDYGFTLTKTASVTTVAPGGVIGYTITLTSTGTKKIQSDEFVSLVDPDVDAPPVLQGDPWPLETNDKATWTAQRTVPSDTALCGTTLTNTATATIAPPGQLSDPPPKVKVSKASARKATARKGANQNNAWSFSSSATSGGVLVTGGICPVPPPLVPAGTVTPAAAVSALRPAALTLEKTGPARMLAGGFGVFQIRVTNTGQADATEVVLRDLPPSALLWRSVPSGASVSGRNAEWKIGTIGAGQTVTKTVSFRARLNASGRLCNTATVSSAQAGAALDRACTTIVAARRPATPVTG